ncbi:MAG TPA: hypothetical protein VMF58_13960 [Rhizomicrobium sp.]|nr:hypothetical protein [Rhizomicrobium sp.]
MRKQDFQRRVLRGCIATAFATFAAAAITPAQAGPNTLVTFDAPGSGNLGTYPMAINGKSVITGYYSDANHVNHGFVGTATGSITTFDAPDATTNGYDGTVASAINASGVITGHYTNNKQHGFVRESGGTIDEFDIGLGNDTIPTAINNKGVVTGSAASSGFVRAPNGNITQFSAPSAVTTSPHAINSAGTVAGSYYTSDNNQHGFFRTKDGTITTFNVPGGFDSTYADGINQSGDITGYAYNNAAYVGFVRKAMDGTFTIFFNIDGCKVNDVFPAAINADGTVTGVCFDGNSVQHGFVRAPDGTIKSFSVPNANGGTTPTAIAANGKTVGYANDVNFVAHGFRLNAGKQ